MSARPDHHLHVESGEALRLATDLARALDQTTTEVVVTALRQFRDRQAMSAPTFSPAQAFAGFGTIIEMVNRTSREHPADITADHDFLFDAAGLPK